MVSEKELICKAKSDFDMEEIEDEDSGTDNDYDNNNDDDESGDYENEWVPLLPGGEDDEDSDGSFGDWAKLEIMRSSHPMHFAKQLAQGLNLKQVYIQCILPAICFLAYQQVELLVGTVASFTLTFAVQGLVNTIGDLRGAFATTERIKSVLSGSEVDYALAYG